MKCNSCNLCQEKVHKTSNEDPGTRGVDTSEDQTEEFTATEAEEGGPEYGNATLSDVVTASASGLNIPDDFALHYKNDKFFKLVLEKPADYRNFKMEGGLVYLETDDERLVCVPEFQHNGHSIREILISQAHSILAHLSAGKTLQYIRNQFWWKTIVDDTREYCKTCSVCSLNRVHGDRCN